MTSQLPIHLVIPMSGQGTRFQKAGYTQPKPLISVGGRPMIERLLDVFPERWPAFAILAENHRQTALPKALKEKRQGIRLEYLAPHQKGPGYALKSYLDLIPKDAPVLVSYCDYGMVWDPSHFEDFVRATNCDACLVSYRGFHAHYLSPVPYAYSRMDGERVVEVKEKGWFGSNRELEYASCGAYYFRTADLLTQALEAQEKMDLILNGESYTSLTVQALLQSKKDAHVRVFEIPYFFQWGTPEDLEVFEYWHRTLTKASHYQGLGMITPKVAQILMPMCGLGSRFTSITPTPKPFIPIDGQAMFQSALQTLPPADKTCIVALQQHQKYLTPPHSMNQGPNQDLQVKFLPETPPGQALSVQAGLSCLQAEGDILISSCDHGIVLNPDVWKNFRSSTQADAAIFTIQGFPGGERKPTAFAWVETDSKDSRYPKVTHVSVKNPISDTPIRDPLLVGTFWFRNKKILESGLESLITKDTRVNGEVYLDSIFNELIAQGFKVNVIPLEGYICWGDPDSLAESLYWQEVYFGRSYSVRPRFPGVL